MKRDDVPDCAITLYYYLGPGNSSSFSYYCTSSSQGWNVQTNGSIHPPSRRRIIQIRLDAYPRNLNPQARFAGFQMGLMSSFQMIDSCWTPWRVLKQFGVKPLMEDYPRKLNNHWTTPELIFDMTEAKDRLAYCLAVKVGDSDPHWDDPKIYDDGSQ